MSIRHHSRERGITIKCNYGGAAGEGDYCPERFTTGVILVKPNRIAAKKQGWGRGLLKGRFRLDLCPTHMELEREALAANKAKTEEQRKKRDEKRAAERAAAKLAKETAQAAQGPKPKKPRAPRARKSSPSAASAPAAPTASSPPPS